jgi:hypothetical protein
MSSVVGHQLKQSNNLNLHFGALGQPGNFYARAGRRRVGEKPGIHLVDLVKVVHVGNKHRCFEYPVKGTCGCFQNGLEIEKNLAGLRLDIVTDELAGGWIERKLPRGKNQGVCFYALNERTESRRCIRRTDRGDCSPDACIRNTAIARVWKKSEFFSSQAMDKMNSS